MAQDSPRANGTQIELSIERARGRHRGDGLPGARPRFAPRAGRDQPDRQRLLVLRTGRERPGRLARARRPPTTKRPDERVVITVDDDGPGIPAARARTDLRALLHRSAQSGFRTELRARAFDLATDRRGARRPDLGDEPARRAGRAVGTPASRRSRARHGAGRPFRRRTAGVCPHERARARPGRGLHATAVVFGESGVSSSGRRGRARARWRWRSWRGRELDGTVRRARRRRSRLGPRQPEAGSSLPARRIPAGLIERRAAGLQSAPSEPAAVVRLVVELSGRGRELAALAGRAR